ncbi:hypothetical protein NKR19_g7704 [Coniochaeta hoffmannii]|uniref:RRM domain-containing protein n=1 Tax=Coniochaeta hoffmannii TaxID=91930 RepID=A0AA38VFV7_9PEZI|nr:hypothetical protein NKR19_g7704 [Coniochaeta hoffmannii]
MDSTQQDSVPSAVTDGRRIYLGNLLYSVKPEDVDAVLKEHNLGKYDKIHLSFDPISARNPGYCFVEFFHKDDADAALTALAGAELAGRPLKVGPCHAKAPSSSQREAGGSGSGSGTPRRDYSSPVSRWGDFKRERDPASPSRPQPEGNLAKAMNHYDDVAANGDRGRRLFVGGLTKMENQTQHQDEIRGYFAGYEVEAVGKRITPREEVREVPGNHHYCFVDLASAEDAQRAIKELDGTPIPAGTLKVSQAKPPRPRQSDGTGYENRYSSPRRNGALAENGDRPPRSKMESPQPQRSLMSNNWRAKAA